MGARLGSRETTCPVPSAVAACVGSGRAWSSRGRCAAAWRWWATLQSGQWPVAKGRTVRAGPAHTCHPGNLVVRTNYTFGVWGGLALAGSAVTCGTHQYQLLRALQIQNKSGRCTTHLDDAGVLANSNKMDGTAHLRIGRSSAGCFNSSASRYIYSRFA